MQRKSAPKPANLDRQQLHARVAHIRANYEDTCFELAWATAIVSFILLALIAFV